MRTFGHDGSRNSLLWGLVLAAGDGRRLQGYIQKIRGDDLPKQYVNFVGRRSMLEHTFDRAEKAISPRQLVTVVGKQHLQYTAVQRQLSRQLPANLIVQPENKETLPGILLPLMHVYKRCPDAIVALFPSDHFILEEDRFMDHVAQATRAVAHDPSRLVLLAIESQEAETEYGYVVPRANEGVLSFWGTHRAARFVEKPNAVMARALIDSGALWNTMIMVFRVRTLLGLVQRFCPNICEKFMRILPVLGSADEVKAVRETYRTLEPVNFSKAFLERLGAVSPELMTVLPVLNVCWSDWGSAERLLRTQEQLAALQAVRSRVLAQHPKYRPSEPRRARPPERAIEASCERRLMRTDCKRLGLMVAIVSSALLAFTSVTSAQSVRDRAEVSRVVTVEKFTAATDGEVSGQVINHSNHTVRDVQLFIRYTWLWDNETKPGKDDPGASTYYTLPKEIPPGGSAALNFKPSTPLAKAAGGHFETSVAVAGFTEVIPQSK